MSVAAILHRTPLPEDKARLLADFTDDLDAAGLWWLSGYAAGLAQRPAVPTSTSPERAEESCDGLHEKARLTIIYGSQTGNAQRVATELAQRAQSQGSQVCLLRADAYPIRELKNERLLYVVISTQGDGDPPDDARGFVEFISGKRAPKLPELRFAILGLGDSSYPQFCAVARKLDERLDELGATRLFARGEADLDIERVVAPWSRRALEEAQAASKPRTVLASVTPLRPQHTPVIGHDVEAEVLLNQRITAPESARDVRHIELALDVEYEPGDALLVTPRNPPGLVDEALSALRAKGDEPIAHRGKELPLRFWLEEGVELTRLSRPFVAIHAQRARDQQLSRLLEPERAEAFSQWLRGHQAIDLLQAAPGAWNARELIAVLRPLAPRAYSIASSRNALGEEAHLTVARLEYEHAGAMRRGAASHYLSTRAEGERVQVRLQRNQSFRLPRDGTRDIVMIGPGVGVAPFRAFVQERGATGARGRNWLFFGSPHFHSDFLYQTEWQAALKDGSLHRLDLAFSRDQAEKVYVQHRIRERGRELLVWLREGAHLYVCGDVRMAKDVHAALTDVVAEHGAHSHEGANAWLDGLQREGRYARDVY